MTIKLRMLDSIVNTDPHQLPVAFEGLPLQCITYAQEQGYRFKPDRLSIFGGYYAHPETGNCLIPTY